MPRPETPTHTLALACATGFGAGYAPAAPGTFGSAVGLALWWLLPASPVVQIAAIVMLFGLGAWSGTIAERHFHTEDPGPVVIDEVMGMLITMFMMPVDWTAAIAGFLLFRLFDIVKPFPARRFEKLPGGTGIMADDAMAAVYANVALRLVMWLW